MQSPHGVDELCELTVDLARRNNHRGDCYIRPLLYKGSCVVGVRMHNLEDHLAIFSTSLGKYIEAPDGCRCCTSSFRRIDDNAIPARAKVTGGYVNSALAKTEAQLNGFDEAIMLTNEGHVCEGSGENIFIVNGNTLLTPPASDNILVGITRGSVMQIARDEFGIDNHRAIDRPERAVRRGRVLHDRNRGRDYPRRRGRPSTSRYRQNRTDYSTTARNLL